MNESSRTQFLCSDAWLLLEAGVASQQRDEVEIISADDYANALHTYEAEYAKALRRSDWSSPGNS